MLDDIDNTPETKLSLREQYISLMHAMRDDRLIFSQPDEFWGEVFDKIHKRNIAEVLSEWLIPYRIIMAVNTRAMWI